MRILAAAAVLTVLGATACSTEAEMRAVDPASGSGAAADASSGEVPQPVPDGEVRTSGLVTVIDDGDGPELCLGAVAESYPPQCGGPALADFDWGDVGSEEASGVRWGSYALTGTFDGSTFTVTDAIPAALYDTMAEPEEEPLAAACDEPDHDRHGEGDPRGHGRHARRGLRAADVRLRVAHRQHDQRRRHRGRRGRRGRAAQDVGRDALRDHRRAHRRRPQRRSTRSCRPRSATSC